MAETLTRAERLDRLPFTRKHTKLLVGSGVGWALDAMDVGLISFVMAALGAQWGLKPDMLGYIAMIGFVGMAVGASLGGWLADRIGRRNVFALTLVVYGVATGASALVPGPEGVGIMAAVAILATLRFFVGLGLGAELPVASTLVSEYAPKAIRGRVIVGLEAFWAVGWIMAALLGYFLIPVSEDGWRWALGVGIVPTLYALYVRFGLPESVRYLEKQGRVEEAEAAVRIYEEAANVPAVPSPDQGASANTATESIWSPQYRVRTAALWIVWFCINLSYYGAFIWIPSILVGRGFPLVRSFGFTLIITLAQLPGYAVAAWLIEVWGRRITLSVFLLGSAISAGLFGFAPTETLIIVFGCMLSFFNLGAWGALYAVGPELYPTGVRGTGTGAAAGFGRIASIITTSPWFVPVLLAVGGVALPFSVFGVAFLIAAGAALLLPEQRGTALAA
ncbi:MFS transporter [Propioniciclava sp. MC1683]|uniref:MFS transporter n=1 Tax=Propioniciclava sp. MC1683 TaxID=2760309 RepID=UPI001602AB3A|nr:MFS transporter [Propioniciclava sp. MC1683]MBB1500044.1 MFS transporter [Propioniciclava sp. MC1683]